jgi:hypothetical protein
MNNDKLEYENRIFCKLYKYNKIDYKQKRNDTTYTQSMIQKSLFKFSNKSFSKKIKKEVKIKELINLNDFKPLFKANKDAIKFIYKTRFLSSISIIILSYNTYKFSQIESIIVQEHKNEIPLSDNTSDIFSINNGLIENDKKKKKYFVLALFYTIAMGCYLIYAKTFYNMSKHLVLECDYNNQDFYLKFVKYNFFFSKTEILEKQNELTRNYSSILPHYTVVNRNNWRRYLICEDYFNYANENKNKKTTIEDVITDKESEIRARGKQILVRKIRNDNAFFKKKSSNRRTLILFSTITSCYLALEYFLTN